MDVYSALVQKDGNFSKGIITPSWAPHERPIIRENYNNFRLVAKEDLSSTVRVVGKQTLDPIISRIPGEATGVSPIALTNPIYADGNRNKKYDPVKPDKHAKKGKNKKSNLPVSKPPKKPVGLTVEELEAYKINPFVVPETTYAPVVRYETDYNPKK